MLASKRKLGDFGGLGRRVRARKEEEPEVDLESSDAPSEEDVDASGDRSDEEEQGSGDSSEEEADDSEAEDTTPSMNFSTVSFGDLAKAHAALSKQTRQAKKKAASEAAAALPRSARAVEPPAPAAPTPAAASSRPAKRSSKHAPTEMSSRRAVSRKRDIISDTRPKARDPRFDGLGGALDEQRFKKAYAFLDAYRDDEIRELRQTIKKTADPRAKEQLGRELKSMEGRRVTERKKEEERKVLEEHKKKEKELVRQGKSPYYLKKAEQKQIMLAERFKGMSKGKVEKAIVRRRKKEATRDRREYAQMERATGSRAKQG